MHHLSDEQLIRMLDGELGRRDRASVERHVEACWGCRRRLDQFRTAMDRFVEFDAMLAEDPGTGPPREWSGFSYGLRGVAAQAPPAPSPAIRRVGVLAPAFVVSICIAALWFAPATPVSAKEVYERSAASERALLGRTQNPLVIQKVRVESNRRTALWSVWRAPVLGKVHESWDSRNDPALRDEVEKLYSEHGLDFSRPLSIATHSLVHGGEASVQSEGELLRVTMHNQARGTKGEIVEAQLVVRASDWHPVEASFAVSGGDGEKRYRMVEASYRVESINAETARVFDPPTLAEPARIAAREPELEPRVELRETVTMPPIEPAVNPVETEIEALSRLHQIGADRQDSATVERQGSNVRVTAYAETAARKTSIENTLADLPGLTVNIHLLSDSQPVQQSAAPVALHAEPLVSPLFLRTLRDRLGSTEIANGIVSKQMDLLWELRVESGAAAELARRFPRENSQKLDALALDHLNAAGRAWAAMRETAGPMLAAIGVSSSIGESNEACADWRSRSISSAGAARRLAELYTRAFTLSASAPNDEISEETVRKEVPGLRSNLALAFSGGCLRGVN